MNIADLGRDEAQRYVIDAVEGVARHIGFDSETVDRILETLSHVLLFWYGDGKAPGIRYYCEKDGADRRDTCRPKKCPGHKMTRWRLLSYIAYGYADWPLRKYPDGSVVK